MAKETRSVKQYKVWYLIVKHKDEHGTEHQTPVAVFDEADMLDAYSKASKGLISPKNARVSEEWTELKPVPDNFSQPLNPDFDAAEFKARFIPRKERSKSEQRRIEAMQDSAQASKKAPASDSKPEDVSSLIGLKIGRKGGAQSE